MKSTEGFDVEKLPWSMAAFQKIRLEGKGIMKETLKINEVPETEFVRYTFPGKIAYTHTPKGWKNTGVPIIIVSFSGNDCIIHRINRGEKKPWENQGLVQLWGLVKRHLLSQKGLRIWTGYYKRNPAKEKTKRKWIKAWKKASTVFSNFERRTQESLVKRERAKEAKRWNALNWLARREGFAPRRFGDPKVPKGFRIIEPTSKPLLLRRRVAR